jgi:hypothetical protein
MVADRGAKVVVNDVIAEAGDGFRGRPVQVAALEHGPRHRGPVASLIDPAVPDATVDRVLEHDTLADLARR